MLRGIDVSENNGVVDWGRVASGLDFAIIRIGYGRNHLDSQFYNNINGALAAGLKIGVYHYSYALLPERAQEEARFVVDTLADCGLSPEKLEMGICVTVCLHVRRLLQCVVNLSVSVTAVAIVVAYMLAWIG